ncbi:MAG: hypothetical protein Q7S95_00050 [bacterium]|nr:hypothetical protein [bacterium]
MFRNCSPEEEAREMATSSILEMAGKRLPVHQPDQDEPTDSVELNGYSVVRDDVPAESTDCLSCLLRSEECDQCESRTDEDGEDRTVDAVFANRSMPSFDALFRSRHEALGELNLSVPSSRGHGTFPKHVPGRVRVL